MSAQCHSSLVCDLLDSLFTVFVNPLTPHPYRDTSLIKKRTPIGPYRKPLPRVVGRSKGVVVFLWARYVVWLRIFRIEACALV